MTTKHEATSRGAKLSLTEKLALFEEQWSPKTIASVASGDRLVVDNGFPGLVAALLVWRGAPFAVVAGTAAATAALLRLAG
jgi:hypothetical protein